LSVATVQEGDTVKRVGKLLVVLAFWPLGLAAQGSGPAGTGAAAHGWNELKGEKLEALKLDGDATRGAEAFEICQGCHQRGAVGSPSGAYPRLAGQHRTVLIEQMTDIRSGERKNSRMAPFASEHVLSTQEIADIAAYLQALPIPPNRGQGPGGGALARGKALYVADCAACHGFRGEGNGDKFYPLVAGQNYQYLLRQARAIREGARGNANPDMVKAIKPYGDGDLEAVADYISRLPAP
jgi:cytochrome c553